MSDRFTTVGDSQYKIVDESFEDDYGSLKSNYVVYSKKIGDINWKRESPDTYALTLSGCDRYIPRIIIKCKSCGDVKYEPIQFRDAE